MLAKESFRLRQSDTKCDPFRKTIASRCEKRDSETLYIILGSNLEDTFITTPDDFFLTVRAASPRSSDCVNDVFGGQIKSFGDRRAARFYHTDLSSLREELFTPGRFIHCGINTRTVYRLRICSVDDSIDFHFCYIVSDYLKWHIMILYV